MGGTGEVVMSVAQNDLLSVANSEPQEYTRYQVRAADGSIGWLEAEPNEDATTHRDPVLYSFDYGWDNFKRVFVKTDPQTGDVEDWGRLLQTQNSTFPRLMRTTVAWTSLNVIFHLVFGMILALLLNRPGLKLRGIYRAIIILPWAIPQPIIALAWKGEFHYQYGFVNTILREIGVNPINWLYTPAPAFAAVTFVNIWLGIPFYMVTLLGGLQSIAGEYYEAAEIDGANAWQKFRNVTVPLIRPVAVPIITLDVIWTFNNFNVIYLITKGEPNETSNILVTALYNAAFGENGQTQLGFAAAFSLVIFLVLFLFASVWVTSSGALKGVYES
jgi:arabinogalactan oligomer/maltooligosaccharide transport system permease protein